MKYGYKGEGDIQNAITGHDDPDALHGNGRSGSLHIRHVSLSVAVSTTPSHSSGPFSQGRTTTLRVCDLRYGLDVLKEVKANLGISDRSQTIMRKHLRRISKRRTPSQDKSHSSSKLQPFSFWSLV